jgi:imidazole glycerol-phosphate synthase subunit HisH
MITIVNYGVGNVASLVNMFEHIGADTQLSGDPEVVAKSPQLVLPGVGAFGHAMNILNATGLTEAVRASVAQGGVLLGVCLGMQLLGRSSEEGDVAGLGLIAADTKQILPSQPSVKIPNMGWREIRYQQRNWMSPKTHDANDRFYFAHSYHMVCDDAEDVVATLDYDGLKTIAVANGSVYGVQFHPEKSHYFGIRLLSDFAQIKSKWS